MLNTKQKISFGSTLITFSIIFVVLLILVQTSEAVNLFYEFMFLVGGILLGLGTTFAISGLIDHRKSNI